MKQQLSFSQKFWEFHSDTIVKSLPELQALLLKSRGLETHDAIHDFLNPSLANLVSPWDMEGMKGAIKRISNAIKKKERIVVFGDFDTDGITATVILVSALRELGAQVSYRIPDRNTDSHGLKKHLIDELAARDVKLVITVDCGVNDKAEIFHAKKLGLDVIVTDHHEPNLEQFPDDAIAIVNPRVGSNGDTCQELAGAAVSWKVAAALLENELGDDITKIQTILDPLLEMVAVGIIADCVTLVGENRILTKFGLEKLKKTQWDGLDKLLEKTDSSRKNISEETVGFVIAPHLNAASRVGDVLLAAQIFLGEEQENNRRIEKLLQWNKERRALTEQSVQESISQIRVNAPVQIFHHPSWKPGILGLLAARHSQQLGVPAIACTTRPDGKISASCRAPESYSIIEGLRGVEKYLERFGGHAGAAGFLMAAEDFEDFKDALTTHFSSIDTPSLPQHIDAWVEPELLNWDLIDSLKFFAPFGAGNPAPIFGIKKVMIKEIFPMGAQKNHTRITGVLNGEELPLVAFFAEHFLKQMKPGVVVDVAVTIGENEWNGKSRLQLRIEDMRLEY